jgi:hypothetical protein
MGGKGYWVKFTAAVDTYPGAHRSPDGKIVGILTGAGRDPITGESTPPRINVVTQDKGHNFVELHDGQVRNVTVNPDEVDWERADVPGDCPAERVPHLLKGAK